MYIGIDNLQIWNRVAGAHGYCDVVVDTAKGFNAVTLVTFPLRVPVIQTRNVTV